jgi:enoyl-CoA hydratase/carnithine racemase
LPITYAVANHVATITIDNPTRANALDGPTSDAMTQAWIDAWEDRDVRCVILTAAGDRHFCSGHNLAARPDVSAEEREFLRAQKLFWPLAGSVNGFKGGGADPRMGDHFPQIWKPVIGAVNGWVAGAGLYLLLGSTDIRIASAEHARFKIGLATLGGIGAGPNATLILKQLRHVDAMKMLLTDEPMDAAEALRVGLVNEVVAHAELLARAEAIAAKIVALPPVALRQMKEFAIRFGHLPTDQLWQVQVMMNAMLVQGTADGDEARRAFAEKRPPEFSGTLRRKGAPFEKPSEEDAARLDAAYRSGEF